MDVEKIHLTFAAERYYIIVMIIRLLILLLVVNSVSSAQEFKEFANDGGEWLEGSILLTNNTEITGLLRYNIQLGILTYQNGNDTRSLTPRTAKGFAFFDPIAQKQRTFFSLEYQDGKSPVRPYFFEVVKDYQTVALISKTSPLQFESKKRIQTQQMKQPQWAAQQNQGPATYALDQGKVHQIEGIYLLNYDNMSIAELIVITETEIEHLILKDEHKTKDKFNGSDELRDFMGEDAFNQLKKYAKENDLRFDKKDDFIRLFDYYFAELKE